MTRLSSPTLRFAGGEVVLADGTEVVDVRVADGRIVAVGNDLEPADERVIDVEGLRVGPGLIDLQVNGGRGIDLAREPERMTELGDDLATHGVTGYLPTIVTSPPEIVARALAVIGEASVADSGARPLGLHLEGPMLNPARAGAHDPDLVRAPTLDLVAGWSAAAGVAMVTIAPELPGALAVIEALVDRGVVVAIGHSDATVDDIVAACAAGATHVTHLYNAMSPLHHRSPGVVGAALVRDELTVGLIVDGLHVHPDAVRLAWRAKGPGGVALVSDAATGRGLEPGAATLGFRDVAVDETGIRTAEGTLAGSTLTLDEAVRNAVALGVDWDDAVRAASSVPAGVLRVDQTGVIEPGRDADLVVLDAELRVVATVARGRIVHDPHGLDSRS